MKHALAQNLPVLLIVVPLLSGLLTAILGRGRWGWRMAVAATWVIFAIAIGLCVRVLSVPGHVISYTMGNWTPVHLPGVLGSVAIGIEYRVDGLNAFVCALVAGMGAFLMPTARRTVEREIPGDRLHFFYGVFLLSMTGLLGITITGDAFNLYVLLEITSLTTYTLVAMGKGRDRRALTASINYLILGTVGASFLLVGIGYLYMKTGTLNMAEMARQLALVGKSRAVTAAFAMILLGLGMKMALFPLHGWLPNAYTYAPTPVSAALASTSTKVGIYVALRFFFTIFGFLPALRHAAADPILIFACLAILHGSIMAIQQTDVKRLLAYSSVAQVGYMAAGFAVGNREGLSGTLIHMLNHAMVKGALFVGIGAVLYRAGSTKLDALRGIGRKMPFTSGALTLAGLGLVGVPLTGGFVSKWHLVSGALQAGDWPVAVVILMGSLLAIVYVLRILEPIYFGKPLEGAAAGGEAPLSLVVPACLLALGTLYVGVSATGFGGLIHHAVTAMLGGGS